MSNVRKLRAIYASSFLIGGLVSACSNAPAKPAAAPPALVLWGDMKPVVSVKELMRDMIDPVADHIFDAVKVETTKSGTVERVPKTDEDWEKIRVGAVTLAEGIYLLKVPRPFAPAGDENNSKGLDPSELSPAQIKAKLEADPVLWNAKIEALRNVGLQVMDIVKRRDAKELWDASDNLDNACESCHVAFWYPVEGEFLKRLDKHLADLAKERELHPDRTRTRPAAK